jgi:hypothetical protein
MMRIFALAVVLVLGCPVALFALEVPEDVRVPVIAIDAGQRVDSALVDAVIRQLDTPVIQGSDLAPRLVSLFHIDVELKRVLDGLFIRASDNFFAGRHEEAKTDFDDIVSFSESQPSAILDHLLRKIVFKTHLYLAIIAKSKNDTARVDKHLLDAALFASDFEPEPAEFPPWLCERFALVSGSHGSVSSERAYRPVALSHLQIVFGDGDFLLVKDDDAPLDSVAEDLLVLTRLGGWTRLVALVGTGKSVEIWLVDGSVNRIVRKTRMLKTDSKAVEKAITEIVFDPSVAAWQKDIEQRRAWYKNGLAWPLVGVGAAMLTTGIVLSQTMSMPSPEEVWAWTLIAGGAGLMGTGTVMFFFPVDHGRNRGSSKKNETAWGITVSGKF